MKIQTLAVTAVSLFLASIAYSHDSHEAGPTDSSTVYVSLVHKGSVNTFLNRLSTEQHQIVVTRKPVQNSIQTLELKRDLLNQYVLAEPVLQQQPRMRGEIANFENIRVVKLGKDPISHRYFYVEKIGHGDFNAPKADFTRKLPTQTHGLLGGATFRSISIDPDHLRDLVLGFSGDKFTKTKTGTELLKERRSAGGRNLARQWLTEKYEALGYEVSLHSYSKNRAGANFVAERKGADTSKYLMVSAHLDSVGNPGADDDGSGTISALAMAEALKDVPLAFNLRIVGFDEEERGLVGSKAYVSHLKQNGGFKGFQGLINIEMTGYDGDGDGAIHIIDCNENTSAQLTAAMENAIKVNSIDLKKTHACTTRSDHAAFWRANQPAIVVSQNFFGGDSNPCYHRSCDRADRMNFDYMAKFTQAIAETVASILAL